MLPNQFNKSFIAAIIMIIAFIFVWEFYWRNKGNIIAYNEDKVLWANARKKIYAHGDKTTVFIGDSRIKFDIDLVTWKALTGEDAVQLALVGTPPRPVLNNLANDVHFRGNVIMGGAEPAFYTLDSLTREVSARDGIEYFQKETPAQKANASLNYLLESNFVFLEEGKFGLNALLNTLPIPNRPGVFIRAGPPRAFSNSDYTRQSSINPLLPIDTALRNSVIRYWSNSAARNRSSPIKGDTLTAFINALKNSIDKIRARGGKVVIIRPPSGGSVLAREMKLYPRQQYWDFLLRLTQCDGFYYTDYPETAHLYCPEESHIMPADAVIFTTALVHFLRDKGWTFRGSSDSALNPLKR